MQRQRNGQKKTEYTENVRKNRAESLGKRRNSLPSVHVASPHFQCENPALHLGRIIYGLCFSILLKLPCCRKQYRQSRDSLHSLSRVFLWVTISVSTRWKDLPKLGISAGSRIFPHAIIEVLLVDVRAGVATFLLQAKIVAGTKISGSALGYIYRTDNLMEKLVNPAKNGQGDWKPTRNLISKFFDDVARDLNLAGVIVPMTEATNQLVLAGFTEWKWDAMRQEHYYFCLVDRTYKYQSGMWLRLDGSSTSLEEEIELAIAQGMAVSFSLEAQMRQLRL
ncbi:hypothetical protein EK21DRAFT_86909 [Setomelanomma holmii]|uniref:Uncharacterized protein n=1 Tax=Setomelanomma holmii TaxID=210430 RepID=A0A9P4HD88_9PLEO|nr:hypothetical protein EK21DRAFT_86909 [Setomelanomma holmii]